MSARAKSLDPVVYPSSDDMAEHELQRFIAELLRPLIERWLRERGVVAHAGADTFFYYAKGDTSRRFSPDVYVIDGVPQELAVSSWKLWEGTPAPRFSFEVVSSDVLKDYDEIPAVLSRVGAYELVLFDPEAPSSTSRTRRRALWTVHRRGPEGFRLVEQTDGDRVYSEALGCFLRVVGEGPATRVRLSTGPRGDELFPTAEERAERANAQAREAIDEVQRLRAELEALRRGR